ncbi:hypothetical protein LSTR_LSTR005152 [Laodelphax striatellus]|uniref:Uncharacterized protein n=1 Tax=Laodelphax striatellus TaxID=195883 RepID=A0A482WQ13_LAOST|nr:hypothetical protein LSTR_LSTR005152 [Laodelphax striatellus]
MSSHQVFFRTYLLSSQRSGNSFSELYNILFYKNWNDQATIMEAINWPSKNHLTWTARCVADEI